MKHFDCGLLVEIPTLTDSKFWYDMEKLGDKYGLEWGVIQNENIIKKIKW